MMNKQKNQFKRLGKIRRDIQVSNEYLSLAKRDEEAAQLLKSCGHYKQAMYLYLQAMEKHIKSKIYSLVNPKNEYFIKLNSHHSLGESIDFLLKVVIANDSNFREQIKEQLYVSILGNINYSMLHNSLRYPFYSQKFNSYSSVDYTLQDCEFLEKGLDSLKTYLKDLDRIN